MQTVIYMYRIDKQLVPLYSIGNSIQYPMINHNGKEYICIYTHTYITETLCFTVEMNTTV